MNTNGAVGFRNTRFLLTLALLIWVGGNLPVYAASARTTLIFSNDVMGEIDPCGCRSDPTGGMIRKSMLIEKLKKEKDTILQLDAGNLLFESESVPQPLWPQAELQAKWLLKAYALLGHDAIAPGPKDFALGTATFERLRNQSGIPFLAANLKPGPGEKLKPFVSHLIVRRGGFKIAILGLVGANLTWPATLKASDPIAAARNWVPKLRRQADLVIALTHQGFDADRELALAVPNIDFILGGESQSLLQTPVIVGKTHISQTSFRNQHIGVWHLPVQKTDPQKGLAMTALDISFDPPKEVSATPSVTRKMIQLVADWKTSIADLNLQAQKTAHSLVRASATSQAEYRSFTQCTECHVPQTRFWTKTRHANAFHVLVKDQQASNLDCLRCHTVGFERSWKQVSDLATDAEGTKLSPQKIDVAIEALRKSALDPAPEVFPAQLRQLAQTHPQFWTPVQCENCHGPGGNHPFGNAIQRRPATQSCLQCHTAERAPEWYDGKKQPKADLIQAKLKSISCPSSD